MYLIYEFCKLNWVFLFWSCELIFWSFSIDEGCEIGWNFGLVGDLGVVVEVRGVVNFWGNFELFIVFIVYDLGIFRGLLFVRVFN